MVSVSVTVLAAALTTTPVTALALAPTSTAKLPDTGGWVASSVVASVKLSTSCLPLTAAVSSVGAMLSTT
ncbi:hypothetical protein D3C78_1828400 [compost metagenome]